MKKRKLRWLPLAACVIAGVLYNSDVLSQPTNDNNEAELPDTNPDDFDDPVDTPLDGGIFLLLAAGMIHGIRRSRRRTHTL